jgi:hypothetical protein
MGRLSVISHYLVGLMYLYVLWIGRQRDDATGTPILSIVEYLIVLMIGILTVLLW